jgi:hypothetical protein
MKATYTKLDSNILIKAKLRDSKATHSSLVRISQNLAKLRDPHILTSLGKLCIAVEEQENTGTKLIKMKTNASGVSSRLLCPPPTAVPIPVVTCRRLL